MLNRFFPLYITFLVFYISCTKPGDPVNPQTNEATGSLDKTGNSCNDITLNGVFIKDSVLKPLNSVNVVVNIITPGSYTIYTDTVNGISFGSKGNFSQPGLDTITLAGNGKPLNSGTHLFTVNFSGSSCTFSINTTVPAPPTETVDSITVYFGSYDGYFYAVQGISGKLKWRFQSGKVNSSASLLDSFVYIGSYDHCLYALNARTGAFHWKYFTGFWPDGDVIDNAVTSTNGHVYFSSQNGKTYGIDTTCRVVNGIRYPKVKWIYKARVGSPSAPAVGNGLTFFGGDTVFYAVDAVTGAVKWKYSDSNETFYASNPTISNGIVYVLSTDNNIHAFNIASGNLLWKFDGSFYQGAYHSSPTVVENILYIMTPGLDVTGKAGVCAINATTGNLLWVNKNSGMARMSGSSPAVVGGVIYCGAEDGYLYAWDASNGNFKWKTLVNGALYSSPTVVGKMLYIGSTEGYLCALDAITGAIKWKYQTGYTIIYSSPLVVGASGKVYHPGNSGGQN